jgi:hypothetical protein
MLHRQKKMVRKYNGPECLLLRHLNRSWISDDFYRPQLESLHV